VGFKAKRYVRILRGTTWSNPDVPRRDDDDLLYSHPFATYISTISCALWSLFGIKISGGTEPTRHQILAQIHKWTHLCLPLASSFSFWHTDSDACREILPEHYPNYIINEELFVVEDEVAVLLRSACIAPLLLLCQGRGKRLPRSSKPNGAPCAGARRATSRGPIDLQIQPKYPAQFVSSPTGPDNIFR